MRKRASLQEEVMKSNCFWQIPQFKKFRIIFEDSAIMVGASEDKQYQTFRKDNPYITFSEKEALEAFLNFQPAPETSLVMTAESI
jgi:hypothetical protein